MPQRGPMRAGRQFVLIVLSVALLVGIFQHATAQQLVISFAESQVGEAIKFGYAVAAAGDLNKDGYDDFVVGAPGCSTNTGCAYVCFGGSWTSVVKTGPGTNSYFGCSVAGGRRREQRRL